MKLKSFFNGFILSLGLILIMAVDALAAPVKTGVMQIVNDTGPATVMVLGMVVNAANLSALFKNFKTIFNDAMSSYVPQYDKIAMTVPSTTSENTYAWLGAFPKMREWLGERQVKNLVASDYTIKNKDWEVTISLPLNSIEDDQYGVYSPVFKSAGISAKGHPDEIIFDLLNDGFTDTCYDALAFFSASHTFGSNHATAVLSSTNFGTALAKIKRIKDSAGRPLFSGTEQLTLIVPPELEETAKKILNSDYISVSSGSTQNNPWKNAANLIVSPQLTSTTAWFITVDFAGLKPLVFQQRKTPQLISKTNPETSDYVFENNAVLYSAQSRDNAGYGLPQLAFGSTGAG